MVAFRSILKTLYALEQSEGAGARVRRSIGTSEMRNFTPFLMLDHFSVSPDAGFPDHPHRGQETVTLMMKGHMLHEDFTGNQGILSPGDLQFMTAGKGIVHSEMPFTEDGSNVEGMQLWVDLPENLKECEARYRDLKSDEIPIVKPNDKVQVKVISGKSYGVESVKDLAYTPIDYYHYIVKPGGNFVQELPTDFNAFLYILNGALIINDKKIGDHSSVFFQRDGDAVSGVVPENSKDTDFVIIAGKVLNQNIVQHGPFVETSQKRMNKAFLDYRTGTNGFEKAKGWVSEIGSGVSSKLFKAISDKKKNDSALKKDEL